MTQTTKTPERARIFFTGVGGQGTLLATRLVGEAALAEGLPVSMSEIHGMAQRGGVVESSVVVGAAASPTIADGEADILLAFEPLEAARALPKCHAATLAVVALAPVTPFTVATGTADYPDIAPLLAAVEAAVARCIRVEADALARDAGNERAANIALIGVLAGTGRLPISRASWETAIARTLPEKQRAVNLRAFALGFEEGRKTAEKG